VHVIQGNKKLQDLKYIPSQIWLCRAS